MIQLSSLKKSESIALCAEGDSNQLASANFCPLSLADEEEMA